MTYYTEVPVVLRFRSDKEIDHTELNYRIQMAGIDGLVEFKPLEDPMTVIDAGWVRQHRRLAADADTLKLIRTSLRVI